MGKYQKKTAVILSVVMAALFMTGCGGDAEQNPPSVEEEKEVAAPEKTTYTFVDVLGESYEAELLPDVPSCPYDFEYLTWVDGYPYYKGEDGSLCSELGVDVSKYQGEIDWQQVKAAGISFAIIRLGFRGYGEEGKIVLDECYEQNVQKAQEAGLKVGVYFFSQAVDRGEAEEEARFVLEQTAGYAIDGPIVYDTEEIKDDTARTDDLTKEQFTEHCIAFCDTIKEAGKEPMIYANMKWMAFTLDLEKLTAYKKWYADYEPVPQCPYEFTVWQYTESGTVPGIPGNADLNVWFHI